MSFSLFVVTTPSSFRPTIRPLSPIFLRSMPLLFAVFGIVPLECHATVLGSGPIPMVVDDDHYTNAPTLDVSLETATLFQAGTYTVTAFSTRFTIGTHNGGASGTVTPLIVALYPNDVDKPVVIGEAIDATASIPTFTAMSFGVNNIFTLDTPTILAAAVYSTSMNDPIAFGRVSDPDAARVFYGQAAAPVIGTPLSSSPAQPIDLPEIGDYTITVSDNAAVPEPSSVLILSGASLAAAYFSRRRRSGRSA